MASCLNVGSAGASKAMSRLEEVWADPETCSPQPAHMDLNLSRSSLQVASHSSASMISFTFPNHSILLETRGFFQWTGMRHLAALRRWGRALCLKWERGTWGTGKKRDFGEVYPKALRDMFAYHSPKGLNQGALPPWVEESASLTAISPAYIGMYGVYFWLSLWVHNTTWSATCSYSLGFYWASVGQAIHLLQLFFRKIPLKIMLLYG